LTRNHYDRLVHFAYGLLIAYPAYELLEPYAGPAGSDYVGAQGDPWDAQKDMALATGGAMIAMFATALAA
jgi:putative membrane protein